jgi:steroid delta-isomerase-like uncharacterized protein
MSPDENKTIVRRYLETAWNKKDSTIVDELVAPDFVQHAANVPPGREGVKKFFQMVYSGIPDARFTLDNIMAEGEQVATRFRVSGTQSGPFLGIPPTGKSLTITGMALLILREGKITENWNELDMLGALRQLGVIPKQ